MSPLIIAPPPTSLFPHSALAQPPWWWLGPPSTEEEEAVQTVLAHGVDAAAPGVMPYAREQHLQQVAELRQRTQLILLHKRALPLLTSIGKVLQRLTDAREVSRDVDPKALQVGRLAMGKGCMAR